MAIMPSTTKNQTQPQQKPTASRIRNAKTRTETKPHRERHRGEPVHQPQVPGAQPDVDGGAVAQPCGKQGLEEEPEVHGGVDHALGTDRQPPGLTDDKVGPLHHNDGDEEGRLGVGEGFLLYHAVGDVLALRVVIIPRGIWVVEICVSYALFTGGGVGVLAAVRAAALAVHHVLHGKVVENLAALFFLRSIFVFWRRRRKQKVFQCFLMLICYITHLNFRDRDSLVSETTAYTYVVRWSIPTIDRNT